MTRARRDNKKNQTKKERSKEFQRRKKKTDL
jgi:hypothetical protein